MQQSRDMGVISYKVKREFTPTIRKKKHFPAIKPSFIVYAFCKRTILAFKSVKFVHRFISGGAILTSDLHNYYWYNTIRCVFLSMVLAMSLNV